MDFSQRSSQKELLDRDDIPFGDIRRNMKELDVINSRLGGHKITVFGFEQLFQRTLNRHKAVSICEIGCGGGDNLRVLKRYCSKRNISAVFSGIDINPHCISFAAARPENEGMTFIASDYKQVKFTQKPDIIFSSLFTHHFVDNDVVAILRWMKQNANTGFFINDLQRHPIAYYSIKWLTRFFSKSHLVKNDAPLSVLRGFIKSDWQQLTATATITDYDLRWKWAFRWLLVHYNGEPSTI